MTFNPNQWTFKVDETGDIDLNNQKQITTVRGEDSLLQDLRVAMTSFRGEDEIDRDFGFDLFGSIPNENALKREIRRVLEYDDFRHARVQSIASLEILSHGGRREGVEVRARINLNHGTEEPTTETVNFNVRPPNSN